MGLKVYADRTSQPSRAIIIFCKMNQIDFEEVKIDLSKGQHRTPEFEKINPMKKVPAIVDGRFKLFESHAILRYLACSFPSVSDHWYPNDLTSRAKIDSILDWHHANLRQGAAMLIQGPMYFTAFGLPLNAQVAEQGKKLMLSSLSKIELFWLRGDSRFLLGNSQPSIADLSLVCELMELEVVDSEERERILEPHQKIRDWMENVKRATHPHFLEVHGILYELKARLESRRNKVSTNL
ncbi:Glutathione S-transferase [Rhynchospora pubera]|uniref:Glutathione S-transferase n=1 Tax=Rhynchospora pubera TaxID=906938 RepID=A0AAV8EVL3_9POAL|nr:Glutathione S-transferase [Rhynchospora pubera]